MSRQSRTRRLLAGALSGAGAGVVLVLVLFLLVRVNALGDQIAVQQDEVSRSLELIESCTTKGGDCYRSADDRARRVIRVLSRAGVKSQEFIVAVVLCADDPANRTVAAVTACANKRGKTE